MEGNSIKSFENLCKIFEMRIKLDKEKHNKTPNEVIENYEKYSKKIDSIYNKEFEKEIRSLISTEPTLEKEEIRLKKLIKLLEDRLEKRKELEDRFYTATGRYIEGFQLIASEEELEDKKKRLELINRYLTTKNEIDEITSSISKLKDSLKELEDKKEEYVNKNKIMEESLYSTFISCIKNDDFFLDVNEDNCSSILSDVLDKVRENEETLEVTLDSVKSLMDNGSYDDYTSFTEEAEKSYYVWKNREIILKIYQLVINFEDDFEQIMLKREKISDLLEDRKHIKTKLHIDDSDELLDFENELINQRDDLTSEKEILENIINYSSRIKFKEERLAELDEVINSYEILTILREYGIIETYDLDEEDKNSSSLEEESNIPPVLEDIINDTIDPYRIKEVIDYPKTLNIGLAKLKGESVRESVNRKLNPKSKDSVFDDFTKDINTNNNVIEESNTTAEKEATITFEENNNLNPSLNNNSPIWEVPSDITLSNKELDPEINKVIVNDIKENKEKSTSIPVWTTDLNNDNIPKKEENTNEINNNMFWVPFSDTNINNNSFPNINIPINNNNNNNNKDNLNFPSIN